MAFAIDPNEEQQQNQPGQPQAQAPVSTSSAPGAGPSGAKTPTGAASNQTTAQPFTNLQSYLTANAPQIQNQANTISGNLNSQYGQVQGDVNKGASDFGQQVQAGYAAENPTLVSQAAANPTNFAQDPNNVKAFQSQINDQYTGPTNFEGTPQYGALNTEVGNATSNAKLLGTPSGVQTYLQSSEKNPTQGENLLDSVLLQQSPKAIQQVQAAAAPFSQLPQYLSSAVATADQGAAAAPGAAQAAAANAQRAFTGAGGVVPTWEQGLQDTLAKDTSQTQAYNTGINNLIGAESSANPQLADVMTALGSYNTNAKGYSETNPYFNATSTLPQISGVDLQNFNNPATQALPNQNQVASGADVAEQNALQQLLGSNFNPFLTDTAQAGSFKAPGAVPTLQSYLQPQLDTLGAGLTGAQNAYTANGALTPAGTPAGSIVNDRDIPTGDIIASLNAQSYLNPGSHVPVQAGPLAGTPIAGISGATVMTQAQYDALPEGEKAIVNKQVSTGGPVSASGKTGQPLAGTAPQYANNSGNLTALQKAYQSLQQYLAAQGG